jgi:hypothetical protein
MTTASRSLVKDSLAHSLVFFSKQASKQARPVPGAPKPMPHAPSDDPSSTIFSRLDSTPLNSTRLPSNRPPSLRNPPSTIYFHTQLNTGEEYHSSHFTLHTSHFTLASNQVDSYPLHRIDGYNQSSSVHVRTTRLLDPLAAALRGGTAHPTLLSTGTRAPEPSSFNVFTTGLGTSPKVNRGQSRHRGGGQPYYVRVSRSYLL